MRKGILSSLPALLAGTSLALAQPPANSNPAAPVAPQGMGQPTYGTPPHDAGAPMVDGPRSPYWPNPFGALAGAAPVWGPQAPHDDTSGHGPHRQLVVWGGAEYLLWWVKNQPVGVPLVTGGTPGAMPG